MTSRQSWKNNKRPFFAPMMNLIIIGTCLKRRSNKLKCFINDETEDIVWLGVSGTLMTTKCSTLGLCKYYVFIKQFDDPL